MKTRPRHLAVFAFLLLYVAGLPVANAQSCDSKFTFKFADGGAGCLSEFALLDIAPVGRYFSVGRMVPAQGSYNIAMTSPAKLCPAIIGFAMTRLNFPGQNNAENSASARSTRAMAECSKALADAKPAMPNCSCALLVEDGVSPMTRAEFVAYVGAAR